MMRDDYEFNSKFVSIIEKHSALYDFNCREYNIRQLVDKEWMDVAEEAGYSVEACKKRWKNIRGAYLRDMKPSNKPRKEYYLKELLQFMAPYAKPREQNGNAKNDSSEGLQNSFDGAYETFEETLEEDSLDDFNEPEVQMLIGDSELQIGRTQDTSKISSKTPIKRKAQVEQYTADDIVMSYYRKKELEEASGGMLPFFKSLLPHIQDLSLEKKWILKKRIMEVIEEVSLSNNV